MTPTIIIPVAWLSLDDERSTQPEINKADVVNNIIRAIVFIVKSFL